MNKIQLRVNRFSIKFQDNSMRKEQALQQVMLGQLDIHLQKNELGLLTDTGYAKVNSKQIMDLIIS